MRINADNKKALTIGRQGEKGVTTVAFDVRGWLEQFGTGTFTLLHQRSGDDGAYPVKTVLEDGELLWTVDEADVFKPGIGVAQLMMMVDGKVVKSELYKTSTSQSLNETKKPPEAWKAWVDSIFEAVGTYPRINTVGNWEVFEGGAWTDSGVSAKGKVPVKGVDYFDGKDGRDGRDGTDGRDGVDGLPGRNGTDGHTPVMTGSKEGKTSTVYADGVPLISVKDGEGGGGISDVTLNGASIVNDGVANIPLSNVQTIGAVFSTNSPASGTEIINGRVYVNSHTEANIDNRNNGTYSHQPLCLNRLDYAVKAALTDGKGADYSDAEKAAARERIGVYGGKFVLIDEITTTEPVSRLDLTTEPDGTPYDFLALDVVVISPVETANGSMRMLIDNVASNGKSIVLRNTYGAANRSTRALVFPLFGNTFSIMGGLGPDMASISTAEITTGVSGWTNIKKITFFMASINILAGTKFRIMAVRA